MALGSTQPLTGIFLGGKGRPAGLNTICGPPRPVTGTALTFLPLSLPLPDIRYRLPTYEGESGENYMTKSIVILQYKILLGR
jgi:hypothetical protein